MRRRSVPVKSLLPVLGQQRGFDGGSPQSVDGECICGACKTCRAALREVEIA